jgi:hypothetical protein
MAVFGPPFFVITRRLVFRISFFSGLQSKQLSPLRLLRHLLMPRGIPLTPLVIEMELWFQWLQPRQLPRQSRVLRLVRGLVKELAQPEGKSLI